MKRSWIGIVLCGLTLALVARNAGAQAGWQKVADPPSLDKGAGSPEGRGKRFHVTPTAVPLADGYTYTSVLAGTFRARSADIESHPGSVVWTPLDGVPKSGGVNWQAIAWALDGSGDVVTSFSEAPWASMVKGCPCAYYRLPKGATKFVAAGGAHPNGIVGYIVPDGKGRLYSETGFGFAIQRTSDGGKSWGTPPGGFASNPYFRLSGQYAGLYGLTIVDNSLYTGGEGGVLKCDLELKSCAEVAASKAAGFNRNVGTFASNGGPQSHATEIFELARSAPAAGPEGGMNLMKWDSVSNTWSIVPRTPLLGPWTDAFIYAICKLPGQHEYLMTRFDRSGSLLLYTDDAVHWTKYDTTGLPASDARFKSLYVNVNPLSGAKYMVSIGSSVDLWVHK